MCTCIGNSLGANNPGLAKRFLSVITKTAFWILIIQIVLQLTFRYPLCKMLNPEPEVYEFAANVLLLQSAFYIFDGGQGVLAGGIRAIGKQDQASKAALFAYYALTIPIALIAGFSLNLNVYGLQLGIGIGVMT